MDPQACFREFMKAIIERDREATVEHGDNLIGWLSKGGFMPEIKPHEMSELLVLFLNYVEVHHLK